MGRTPCRIVRLVILGLLATSSGASAQGSPLESGRALYEDKCAQCHGTKGDGAGIASARLMPRPRDFTSGSFKIRTTPSGELPTAADLASIIRNGMPYTAMPAWSALKDDQIESLIAYIQTFNEDFSDPEMLVPPIEIPDPPPMTQESREKGREVYLANKCLDCHGDQGRGDGPSAPTLADDASFPIRPADLTRRWSFRGGSQRRDIYRTFTTGLDGTPMPSYADSISEEERWQLVDYIYSLSDDEPDYGTLVLAGRVEGDLEPDPGHLVFAEAKATLFPLVGQVTDPGRQFAPATNAIEVRAVYNDDVVAVQVSWHAMEAGRNGANRPDGRDRPPEGAALSDAVAIQIPSVLPAGSAKPYLLYGDPETSVDLWFYDAARDAATTYLGRGEASIALEPGEGRVRARGTFTDGLWQVVFLAPRRTGDDEGQSFPEATFIPIAFSVWAGHAGETGNRRAISSWYDLYLAPPDSGAAYKAAGGMALFALVAEVVVVTGVRRSRRNRESEK